ncbi:MAG TPA: ABC transporter ATP-binding protein [Actinomycetota bacterium]
MSALLEIEGLRVSVPGNGTPRVVIGRVDLSIAAGESVGLVGESGAGKTMTARAVLRLLPPGARAEGSVRFDGRDVLAMSPAELRAYRANQAAIVFQDPRAHTNPLRTVGDYLTEGLRLNQGLPERASRERAGELLSAVGVENPGVRLSSYPHELSGGLLQRVMIAAALTAEPRLLLADEPTTALDAVTQAEVLAVLAELRQRLGLAMLFITHDLELAAATCDRTAVLHAGSIVEMQRSADLHDRPLHPYTARLVGARLSVDAPPRHRQVPAPGPPPAEPILEVAHLRKVFGPRRGRPGLVAVDDLSFSVPPGGSLALVGESGAGKTTVARMLLGLETPTSGRIRVAGQEPARRRPSTAERRRRASSLQAVFQNPYGSLDPRQRVGACLEEALRLHSGGDRRARRERALQLLHQVGLEERHARSLPSQLSGGQRQRVAIARALAPEPRLLVLDEAVSALDAPVQAQILDLLAALRVETGVAYVCISHNLAVVRQVADHLIVMRNGQVVEAGPTENVLDSPRHPYTRLLRSSVPGPGWTPGAALGGLEANRRRK